MNRLTLFVFIIFLTACGSLQGLPDAGSTLADDTDVGGWIKMKTAFHLGESGTWHEANLKGVLSQVQQIYNQAKIEVSPLFVADVEMVPGAFDVFYKPEVWGTQENGVRTRVNGYTTYFQYGEIEDHCEGNAPALKNVPVSAYYLKNGPGNEKTVDLNEIENNLAVVTAHEMGHGIGLNHDYVSNGYRYYHSDNLMNYLLASNYNTSMTKSQIDQARKNAAHHFGVFSDCTISAVKGGSGTGRMCAIWHGNKEIISSSENVHGCTDSAISGYKKSYGARCDSLKVKKTRLECRISIIKDPQNRGNGRICALWYGDKTVISHYFNVAGDCTQAMIDDLADDDDGLCASIDKLGDLIVDDFL